jgi:hypothetical protein
VFIKPSLSLVLHPALLQKPPADGKRDAVVEAVGKAPHDLGCLSCLYLVSKTTVFENASLRPTYLNPQRV